MSISWAFSKAQHISIALIEMSLINILAPPYALESTFGIIMIMWLQVPNRVIHVQIYAEVVLFVAGSLEAGGLPGSLEVSVVLK